MGSMSFMMFELFCNYFWLHELGFNQKDGGLINLRDIYVISALVYFNHIAWRKCMLWCCGSE